MSAPARWRRLLVRGLLLLGALLALLEVSLRVAGARVRFPTPCAWNDRVGCLMRPHLSDEFVAFGSGFHFTTNAAGRRDRPRGDKPAGGRRVLVLGDSVAFGAPVEDGETFSAQLEARLGGQGVEVVNAGSPWLRGTEQQLSYFLDRGAALSPDVVLLTFTARNDFTDNAHRYFWRPVAGQGEGAIERVERTEPATLHHRLVLRLGALAPVRFLDAHSWLWNRLEAAALHIMHLPPVERPHQDRTAATEDVLWRLQQEVTRAGATLVVLLQPSPELLSALRRHDPPPPGGDEELLLALARRHGIAVIDPTALLASAPDQARLDDADGHLSVRGHAAIAELLGDRLPLTRRSAP